MEDYWATKSEPERLLMKAIVNLNSDEVQRLLPLVPLTQIHASGDVTFNSLFIAINSEAEGADDVEGSVAGIEITRLLLDAGADSYAKWQGMDALEFAESPDIGHQLAAQLIRQYRKSADG